MGVPLEVYVKGRATTPWILQSTEWNDREKAALLNKGLIQFSRDKSDSYRTPKKSFFKDLWWKESSPNGCHSDGTKPQHAYEKPKFKGPQAHAGDYFGPVLFPEKVTLDLEGRLTTITAIRNLAGFLYLAQMKVKVKINSDETASLIGLVEGGGDELLQKVRKHLVN